MFAFLVRYESLIFRYIVWIWPLICIHSITLHAFVWDSFSKKRILTICIFMYKRSNAFRKRLMWRRYKGKNCFLYYGYLNIFQEGNLCSVMREKSPAVCNSIFFVPYLHECTRRGSYTAYIISWMQPQQPFFATKPHNVKAPTWQPDGVGNSSRCLLRCQLLMRKKSKAYEYMSL